MDGCKKDALNCFGGMSKLGVEFTNEQKKQIREKFEATKAKTRKESFLAARDIFAGKPAGTTLLKQSINQGVSNG